MSFPISVRGECTGTGFPRRTERGRLEFRVELSFACRRKELPHLLLDLQGHSGNEAREKWTDKTVVACDIQDSHDLARQWMADWRRSTGEVLPTTTIVFRA